MSGATPLAQHFEAMFGGDADPWRTRTRWYERRKRALALAMLPRERFGRGFEPGCGAGETTLALAACCDELIASDASAQAVAHARRRVAACRNVRVEQGSVPGAWPEGRFDLIMIGELGYYLDAASLANLAAACRRSLTEEGCLIACHWRRGASDMAQSAAAVHAALDAACDGLHVSRYEDEDVLIDVWCADPRSVAQREGLA